MFSDTYSVDLKWLRIDAIDAAAYLCKKCWKAGQSDGIEEYGLRSTQATVCRFIFTFSALLKLLA